MKNLLVKEGVDEVSGLGDLEPLLHVDLGAVVMGRVDEFVGPREVDGILGRAFQVAAPPVGVALVLLDAFDEDQPVGGSGQDGLASLLGRQAPIGAGVAITPAGQTMRLVGQIGPDDGLIALVVLGQHDPILDPARLGDLVGVPQGGPQVAVGSCRSRMTFKPS